MLYTPAHWIVPYTPAHWIVLQLCPILQHTGYYCSYALYSSTLDSTAVLALYSSTLDITAVILDTPAHWIVLQFWLYTPAHWILLQLCSILQHTGYYCSYALYSSTLDSTAVMLYTPAHWVVLQLCPILQHTGYYCSFGSILQHTGYYCSYALYSSTLDSTAVMLYTPAHWIVLQFWFYTPTHWILLQLCSILQHTG